MNKRKKALNNLRNQFASTENLDHLTIDWFFKTREYIKTYIGNSSEYRFYESFSFNHTHETPDTFKQLVPNNISRIKNELQSAIRKVELNPLYKENKPNFLYHADKRLVWLIFSALMTGSFYIGTLFNQAKADHEKIELLLNGNPSYPKETITEAHDSINKTRDVNRKDTIKYNTKNDN